ncbi:DUF333 domain-containing protein [Aeromonas bivalvium]|uniref:DUF333 domain-containing protein n=1 Tax=Aeromonas bivalvium TaxID=440079 RepID=A0ABW9GNN8_9GAMM|nr:DUF333 domain-containing protein [Aeromonas bivalvium]
MRLIRYGALSLLPLLALTGCAESGSAPAPASIGTPNPASVYCADQDGKLVLEQEPGGTVGYCHLPDGTVMEEWTLYRAAQQAR